MSSLMSDKVITREVVPVVRVALRETTELRAAVQLLGERIEALPVSAAAAGHLRNSQLELLDKRSRSREYLDGFPSPVDVATAIVEPPRQVGGVWSVHDVPWFVGNDSEPVEEGPAHTLEQKP